jgi:hypothetical protein
MFLAYQVIAIASFFSGKPGMLDFHRGDMVEVLGERGDGWYKGRIGGQSKIFLRTKNLLKKAGFSLLPM